MKNLGTINNNEDVITKKYYEKLLNQIPAGTMEGDSITIEDSSDLSVKDVVVKGKTEQASKNLFNGQLEQGQYDGSGNKSYASDLYRNANPVEVKANTTYTTSINGVAQKYCLFFYDKNQTYLSTAYDSTGTFTTPANTEYLCFRCYAADWTSDFANLKVQIEEGSTATSYVTFSPTPDYPQDVHRVIGDCSVTKSNSSNTSSKTYPLTLGNIELCKIGDYEDYIYKSNDKWYLRKNINKIIFRGTEGFAVSSVGDTYSMFYINTSQPYANGNYSDVLSNYFKNQSSSLSSELMASYRINTNKFGINFKVLNSRLSATTVAGFKEWLANLNNNGNPVYVIYPILPSTITEITDATLINQLEALINAETYKNITNVITTGEDLAPSIRVVYRKDWETVINNLLSLILA